MLQENHEPYWVLSNKQEFLFQRQMAPEEKD